MISLSAALLRNVSRSYSSPLSSIVGQLALQKEQRLLACPDAPRRPELDFDYLLNPQNKEEIRLNCQNRKGVGDVDKLHFYWNQLFTVLLQQGEKANAEAAIENSAQLEQLWSCFYEEAERIPNRTCPTSPVGNETCNRFVKYLQEKPMLGPAVYDVEEAGQRTHNLTTELSHVCGDRAYAFFGDFAMMEKALVTHTLEVLLQKGFTEITVPDVVSADIPRSCGVMQRSEKGILYYLLKEGGCSSQQQQNDMVLSGTGEMGIAAYLAGKTFAYSELPKRFVTVSRCFRPEVGKKDGGLYRVHEFTKVEMFAVVACETGTESDQCLEELRGYQEEIIESFGIYCRVLDMATQELGASAYRKYDIEAYMPSIEKFGEITSTSNCIDFQSRRLGIKYIAPDGTKKFVHTLNGTACAVPRIIKAIVEQGQRTNCYARVPAILHKAFGNHKIYLAQPQLKSMLSNLRSILK